MERPRIEAPGEFYDLSLLKAENEKEKKRRKGVEPVLDSFKALEGLDLLYVVRSVTRKRARSISSTFLLKLPSFAILCFMRESTLLTLQ